MAEKLLNKGLAREDFSRLLSACYYQPGPEFGEENVFGAMCRAAALISQELAEKAEQLKDHFAAEDVDSLLLDYSRLFLGPFEILAKPYGSVWMEGEKIVMGESTMALLDLYKEVGFELAEDFHEVPDHIAAELEFLYLLIFRENEARRSGEAQDLQKAKDFQRRFLQTHLGRWVGPFTTAVRQGAQTDFYRLLADMTITFIRAEATENY
jgi:TorA maturation chaperone TorD